MGTNSSDYNESRLKGFARHSSQLNNFLPLHRALEDSVQIGDLIDEPGKKIKEGINEYPVNMSCLKVEGEESGKLEVAAANMNSINLSKDRGMPFTDVEQVDDIEIEKQCQRYLEQVRNQKNEFPVYIPEHVIDHITVDGKEGNTVAWMIYGNGEGLPVTLRGYDDWVKQLQDPDFQDWFESGPETKGVTFDQHSNIVDAERSLKRPSNTALTPFHYIPSKDYLTRAYPESKVVSILNITDEEIVPGYEFSSQYDNGLQTELAP